MEENTRSHRVHIVYDFLCSDDIHLMNWVEIIRGCVVIRRPSPSDNHPGSQNNIADRMTRIAHRTHFHFYLTKSLHTVCVSKEGPCLPLARDCS